MAASRDLRFFLLLLAASLATAANLFINPTGSDANNCLSGTPCRTIQGAIAVARTTPSSNSTINIAAGLYSNATHDVGIQFGNEGYAITLSGPRTAIVDCANANFAFAVFGGALIGSAFSINGITIRNCVTALRINGTEATGTFNNVLFTQNTATAVTIEPQLAGGTILPVFTNCDFTNNIGLNGGAIYVHAPTGLPIPIPINCNFINNAATFGGALYILTATDRSNTVMSGLTFRGNTATTNAGSVYIEAPIDLGTPSTYDFDNWLVEQSTVTAYAGPLPAGVVVLLNLPNRNANQVIIRNCSLLFNGASSVAAFVSVNSNFSMSNSEVSDHKLNATASGVTGGALLSGGGIVSFVNVTFKRNASGVSGAGLAISGSVTGSLSASTISNNQAYKGSGLLLAASTTFTLSGVTFANNTATSVGGAVYALASSIFSCANCAFTGNSLPLPATTADGFGGAIALSGSSSATLNGGSLSGNSAFNGGAISVDPACSLTVINVAISNNSASLGLGGALFMGTLPLTAAGTLATLQMRGSSINGNTALSGGAMYFGPVVQATINSTSMQNNSATGSGLSTGGAINFVGSAAVAAQMILTLNGVTFDGNDAPTAAHINLASATTYPTNSFRGLPASGLPCCDQRCIACDSQAASLLSASGGNITCPEVACPTTAAPTTTPPATTQASNNTNAPTSPPPTTVPTTAPTAPTTAPPPPPTPPPSSEKKIIGLKPIIFWTCVVGIPAALLLLCLVVSTILGLKKKKDPPAMPQSRRSVKYDL